MNGDLQDLLIHISDLHNAQMQAIGDLGKQFAEHKGNVDARLGAVETKQQSQENKQWFHSIGVLLVNTAHHALSTHFGWKV